MSDNNFDDNQQDQQYDNNQQDDYQDNNGNNYQDNDQQQQNDYDQGNNDMQNENNDYNQQQQDQPYDNNQDNNQQQQQQDYQDDMYKPQETHFEEDTQANIYHRHNKMIFGNFVNEHNEELITYFNDFSKEEEGSEPAVKGQDFPLIMRVAFYIDNITFHVTKEDNEEFFNREDSYKAVIAQLERFAQLTQNVDTSSVDIAQHKFNFQQYLDFCEYFIQNEPSIFLRRVDNEALDQSSAVEQDKQQTELEAEIKQNIAKYEGMLEEASTENERIVINNMLKALYDQLGKIETLKQPILNQKPRKRMTKEEIRKKNLQEIFTFYCKQQYTQAPKYSFDRILYESHTMNMSNFLLFAKQFKVTNYCLKLTKKQLPQLFKKVSNNYKDLTFQEFQILLEKIAILMFEEKEDLPSEFDKIEAFYKYMGVDDPNFYRQHMHLLNPPFNIQDKVGFRHLPKDQERKIELRKIPPKLKNELDKRKKEKELLVQKYVSMTPAAPSQKHFYSKSQPPLPNGGLANSQSQKSPFSYQYDNYAARNHQKQVSKLNLNNKVSWQQLEQISYADMKQLQKNDKFKPTDLFQEHDDNEDRIYLQQYNLEEEKHKKQEMSYIHRKEQETYGASKGNLRPTQKYLLKHDPNYSERGYVNSNVHRSHQQEDPNNPYYGGSPSNQGGYYNSGSKMPKNQSQSYIGQSYMQRAQQVDNYQRDRENQQAQQHMYQQDQKIQRGMYAAKR